jgi:hypothetical protein
MTPRLFLPDAIGAQRLALAGVLLVCLTILALRFQGISDDPAITLVYARNVAAGDGLVFYPGERVLGTTAPLWALLVGAGSALSGASVIAVAGALTLALWVGIVVLVAELLRDRALPGLPILLAPTLIFGSAAYSRGTELPLLLFLVVLACRLERDGRLAWALVAAVAAYTARGEGILLVPILLAASWRRDRRLPRWTALVPATLLLGAWQLYLWLYFEVLLPNTLGAKTVYRYTADFLSSLPTAAMSLFNLPVGAALALILALGVVAFLRAAPATLVAFLVAQLIGYSLLRTADHNWYYYAIGFVEAAGVACGLSWIVGRLWPEGEGWRTAALVLLALALLPSRYALAVPLAHDGDYHRTMAYRAAADFLRPRLTRGGSVLADEIGTLGLALPGKRIYDSDFLVHRRPPGVPRLERRAWLAVLHRPRYVVMPGGPERGPSVTFEWGGRSVSYTLKHVASFGTYNVAIYGAG